MLKQKKASHKTPADEVWAVIYARVSGQQQKEDETILSQLEYLPTWIAEQGWRLVDTYIDDGISASRRDNLKRRKGLAELLADCSRKKFHVVVVVEIDRLSRSLRLMEFGQIFGTLQDNGIKIASPVDGVIEIGKGTDQVKLFMRHWLAGEDNVKRTNATTHGKERVARNGQLASGPAPYGFRWNKVRVVDELPAGAVHPGWSHDPEESAIVQRIFRLLVEERWTSHAIAHQLEAEGVLPASWTRGKPKKVKARWMQAVRRIIRNPAYKGSYVWGGLTIHVPPLVDAETWFMAQTLLGKDRTKGLRRTRGVYICEGIATCQTCGAPIRIVKVQPRGKDQARTPGLYYSYYSCRDRRTPLPPTPRCTLRTWRTQRLDDFIWQDIVRLFREPRDVLLARLGAREADANSEAATWESDRAAALVQLDEVARRAEKMAVDYANGVLSDEAYDAAKRAHAAKRAMLERVIKTAKSASNQASEVSAQTPRLIALVDKMRALVADDGPLSPEERRDIARSVIVPGTMKVTGVGATFDVTIGDDRSLDNVEAEDGVMSRRGNFVKKTRRDISQNVVSLRVVVPQM